MKKFMREFKEFALRGNVMSLAVGVIIGAAFQDVVTSLSHNILMPVIGLFTRDGMSLERLAFYDLQYGAFLTSVLNFIIMAFVIFLLVRGMNKLLKLGDKKKDEAPTQKDCPFCMTKISAGATRCPACTSHLEE